MPYANPPTWVNGTTPALNATNLNVMSDNDRDFNTRIATLETEATRVDTIAALKAIDTTSATNYPTGTTVNVLGYYAAGDKAGTRVYRLNRSSGATDDGGYFIRPAPGGTPTAGAERWVLQSDPQIMNVAWFGAKGDYTGTGTGTDDTVAIQKAFDRVNANSTAGGEVHFPVGQCKITSTIIWPRPGIRAIGHGVLGANEGSGTPRKGSNICVDNAATFTGTDNGKFIFSINEQETATPTLRHNGSQIEHLNFFSETQGGASGVYLELVTHWSVKECSFFNLDIGCRANARDPVHMPTITTWTANVSLSVGQYVRPSTANGHVYLVTASDGAAGTTEPTWPTDGSSSVTLDGVTYQDAASSVVGYQGNSGGDVSWALYEQNYHKACNVGLLAQYQAGIVVLGGKFESTNAGAVHIRNTGGPQLRVIGTKFDNVGTNTQACTGISLEGENAIVANCMFEDLNPGINVKAFDLSSASNEGDDNVIMGCTFYNGASSGVNLINIEATAQNTNVIGCTTTAPSGVTFVNDAGTDTFIVDGYNGIVGKSVGLAMQVVTKTATYTLTSKDYTVIFDASAAARTANLPAAAANKGRVYLIKKSDTVTANAVTIDPNGAETIDGATTYAITTSRGFAQIVSDGTAWHVVSKG